MNNTLLDEFKENDLQKIDKTIDINSLSAAALLPTLLDEKFSFNEKQH